MAPLILWDIIEEHLDEATFLWSQRESALAAPDQTLEDAASWEERLLAHLDGLVVGGGPIAERLLRPALQEEEPYRVASAAFALLTAGGAQVEAVLAALELGEPQRSGVQHALGLSEKDEALKARLTSLLPTAKPGLQAVVLNTLASWSEPLGPESSLFLDSDVPQVEAAALRAARTTDTPATLSAIRRALASDAVAVRDAALVTGAIRGLRATWSTCQRLVSECAPAIRQAMVLLALGGDARDLTALRGLLADRKLRSDALWALGFSGRLEVAEDCLPLLREEDEKVARLAAEAFCAITGLVLDRRFLRPKDAAPERASPPEEEELDADLHPRPEDDLPLANPGAVEDWWREARANFQPEVRHLYGKPFSAAGLIEALECASMRRRHVHALDLAVRSRGQFLLNTRHLAHRQLEQLGSMRRAGCRLPATGFKNLLTVD